jgi:Recombination endonuclease VII
MPSAWAGKACQRCGGRKGAKYANDKYCGNCRHAIRRQRSANAHAAALLRRYGITREDYWDLYRAQGGHCAICLRATGKSKRLTVDHDHKTGLVRGLLCATCNTILGHFRDDPAAGQRIIDYLADPPFSRMMSDKTRSAANGASHDGDGRAGDVIAGVGRDERP